MTDLNELDAGAIGEEAAGERRHLSFGMMIGLILLAGLSAAGAGAGGLAAVAGRHPSEAQVTAAGQRELAVLWQRLPAGRIFPSSVTYLSTLGSEAKAALVGIARQAPCRAAVDARAAAVLDAAGAHFGGRPPGPIRALPPAGAVTWLYLALLAAGALLLGAVVALGWRVSSQQLPKPE